MSNMCVVGLQWGDEGKGKIIDILTEDFDVIVRYQGGNNAGHTVVVGDQKFVLHLIPSGILHEGKLNVIGNGVVFDPPEFLKEVDELRERGVRVDDNLKVSDRAHVVFPYHKTLDRLREQSRGSKEIGTTGRGIGPCYTDKMARCGFRVAELMDENHFREKLRSVLDEKNREITTRYDGEEISYDDVVQQYLEFGRKLQSFAADTISLLAHKMGSGARLLFEGAQGSLLDVDFGTYPFVSSSNASSCGVAAGAGVPAKAVGKILGIMKAYTTRVGGGPFPTELTDELGEQLRQVGGEFGATTGRPRRCGWFDAVAVRHAATLNGVDGVALMKLDVLSGQETLRIGTAYKHGSEQWEHFPANTAKLADVQPVYIDLPGWADDISSAKTLDDLPAEAIAYVRALEDVVRLRVEIISVGSEREQIVRV